MRILQGLLFSLGVHLALVWASQFLPPPEAFQARRERIEFEVVEKTADASAPNGQVVRQPLVPDELLVPDNEDPTFLSERRQRVREQRRAAQSGRTENRSRPGPARPTGSDSSAESSPRPPKAPDLFQLAPRDAGEAEVVQRRSRRPEATRGQSRPAGDGLAHLPPGFSTVGETLPRELEVGSFTSLNTDRYLFYSFFMRIEDLIRYNWESYVKDTINRTPRSHFLQNTTDLWVTQVEIQLTPAGDFHRALLLKSSGIEGFDWAAVDAFSQARRFPNPPQEMVEDDGLIHLKYSFTVHYRPATLGEGPGRPTIR